MARIESVIAAQTKLVILVANSHSVFANLPSINMSPSARGAQICATGSGSGVVPLVSCDGRHNLPRSCRFEAAESALYSRKGGSRLAARHIESLPGLRLAPQRPFCLEPPPST